MTDRAALARFPDPPYTCAQFSSYDRASTGPSDPKTWYANGDADQYLRVEEREGRKEWVMADMDGPGAIVRIWSANPKGTLRIYLDGAPTPVIEAPMTDLLGGKWKVEKPLSEESSRGCNLYLPIPYAKHCKITSDTSGFYYQVNYRTYGAPASVVSLPATWHEDSAAPIAKAQQDLVQLPPSPPMPIPTQYQTIEPAKATGIQMMARNDSDGGAIIALHMHIDAHPDDLPQLLRSTVLRLGFDGEWTVVCPVGDFFGTGVGYNVYQDWYRTVADNGVMTCRWVMPFKKNVRAEVFNLSDKPLRSVSWFTPDKSFTWDDRCMYFHATWRHEHPIHVYGGRGTADWNYVEVTGKGVFVGDNLAVMNPVPEWWGEGDEKIYVDDEPFPSHFGTGTEDYYGYAWCCPIPFQRPFHSQPRCDGFGSPRGDTNWGHTTVTRVRALDAIPFTKSFKFDMELWHWKECDVAYAATTYFYAFPGARTNREGKPDEAAKPIPQPPPLPPPFRIEGAIECEKLKITGKTDSIQAGPQGGFGPGLWSDETHLWVQAKKPGDFVELEIPVPAELADKPVTVVVHATRSWDYGIVRFSLNGKRAGGEGGDIDLFNDKARAVAVTGPIDLGTTQPRDGKVILRAEVVGGNPKSEGTKSFFGLDCIVLSPTN
jgi:hypothetical protein